MTEGRSTGVPKILKAMAANGSSPPVFETDDNRSAYVIRLPAHPFAQGPEETIREVTAEVTAEVGRLVQLLTGEMTRKAIQEALALKHGEHFRLAYLLPALESGMIEMTQPGKPRSSKQRYRLTVKGKRWLQQESP